jgi:anti-sigma-K factor RskA
MSEEHVSDLIPAYVLGCLDPDEKLRVEKHLEGCEACRAELKTYHSVMDGLALSINQIDPPKRLKQSIVQLIEPEGREKPARAHTPRRRLDLSYLRPLLPIWSVVSLVLVLSLSAANLVQSQQVKELSQQSANVYTEFHIVPLNGTSAAPQALGIMIISDNGLSGSLNVDGLPPLDAGHQYQLWLVQEGRRTNGGVFSVSPGGYGTLKINSSRSLIDYNSIGITIEPAGGSPGPTGDKVLGGGL